MAFMEMLFWVSAKIVGAIQSVQSIGRVQKKLASVTVTLV
jgi:hypothetical protein